MNKGTEPVHIAGYHLCQDISTECLQFINENNFTPNVHKNRNKAVLILSTVLLLQVFHKLSVVGYFITLLSAYFNWIRTLPLSKNIRLKLANFVFLFYYVGMGVFSLGNLSLEEYVKAFIRYGAIVPFILFSFFFSEVIYKEKENIINIIIIIVALSALSILYQGVFGKIDFFMDNTYGRLGYERYGSLLGSTTAYGVISPVAILALHDYKPFSVWKRLLIEILVLVGGILCLSKSFFINTLLVYGLLYVISEHGGVKHIKLKRLKYLLLAICVIICSLTFLIKTTYIGNYFFGMVEYTFANTNKNLGVESDFLDRLTRLPLGAYTYYDNPFMFYILCGVGFKGFGGALGLSQYPMCHNNYAEIFLSQSLLALVALMYIYISSFIKMKNKYDSNSIFVKQIVIYIMINMLAGQWNYLTVVSALLLCIVNSCNSAKMDEVR